MFVNIKVFPINVNEKFESSCFMAYRSPPVISFHLPLIQRTCGKNRGSP